MLSFINNIVWGTPLLCLLLGTGMVCSFRSGFFQIRCFPQIINSTFISLFKKNSYEKCHKSGSISQFQAVSASLAAAMGTGNIAGVATAITIGGAGAIFWMWISAIIGMSLVYAENYLGTVYRRYENGRWYGGPMAYLEHGAGKKQLAIIFAVCCALASLGMGCMTQVNSISMSLSGSFGISPVAVGAIVVIVCAAVISGGIKRISSVTQILIPFLSVIYICAALFIIIRNAHNLPSVFSEIFSGAFEIRSAGGGISGAIISRSINAGLRRGVFSNEAGLGSSAVMHSSADCTSPQKQGMWAIFEVFTDTIVCCTLTALVILSTGAHKTGNDGVMLVTHAFSKELGGIAPIFISTAVSLFAFATIIGWFYCGECAVTYIFGSCSIPFYKFIFLISAFAGAVSGLEAVWTISDIFNGLMAIPNLTGLLLLRKEIMLPADQDKV